MIGDRWGATAAELAATYPCDAYVTDPNLLAWRAVTIEAGIEAVWPWIVQLRLAPYSYDWIDNLGRLSPRDPIWLPNPQVGDPFSASAGRPLGRIVSIAPREHLTASIMGVFMSYVLVPEGDRTRLVLKIVGRTPRPWAVLLTLGDLVMARRQLLNLKRLSERHASSRSTPPGGVG